ncbi:signal transducer and activator of transcription 2 [Lacerta agilis]|uniref:signal transducer and activator of transcription 2 n=1 Tax=Lacerta agilis TaxID=80427 RepID=UPI001419DD5E|nr:signal transducer and activator of transcription 2 [Lacerta agilis]
MSQWQQIQKLDGPHLDQVHYLYSEDCLPMEVREYLAYWIEQQNWNQAARSDPSQACSLFHTMLGLLDDQLGRLVLGEENNSNMVLKHNLRRSKLNLQAKYQDHPEQLANFIDGLLRDEQGILAEALAMSRARVEPPPGASVVLNPHHNIEGRLMDMRRAIQGLKCSVGQLEDLQDAFDFRYKTHLMLVSTSTPEAATQRERALQDMVNNVNRCRKELLDRIRELLGRSDTLRDFLLAELAVWQDCQRRACIGDNCDTSLTELEKWFTESAENLFYLLLLLRTLEELRQKVSYEGEPLGVQLPQLEKRLKEQISCLLKSAFVVEIQPSMPLPNRRPLVLRTSNKFSVRARLLVKLLDRNHPMEVKIEIDRNAANLERFRRFNILPSTTKTMVMDRPQVEGLICDFKYIMLKEQKSGLGKGKGSKGLSEGLLPVTEELHTITFILDYCYQDFTCQLQTSTLPVVVISNTNQVSSAWASILWYLMFSPNPTNQLFFCNPPAATWDQLSPVLSWQFLAATDRGLNTDQLKMLREKLCGPNATPQSTVTWAQFAKPTSYAFSFWTWIDGILLLIKEHLLQLWNNALIMGFVSRKREKSLLKKKRAGTFLLRFSESTANGGITFTWVDFDDTGSPKFQSVEPYTCSELKYLALPDIIHDYQFLAVEEKSENPLKYLYPDTPRDSAFSPYYSERREADLPEERRYLNRRLIRVSSQQPEEAQVPRLNDLALADDEHLNHDPAGLEHSLQVPRLNGLALADNEHSNHDPAGLEHGLQVPRLNGLALADYDHLNHDPAGLEHGLQVPRLNGLALADDEHLNNELVGLAHGLQCLLSNRQDPFLPLPGDDQLPPLPIHLFEAPDEIPELNVMPHEIPELNVTADEIPELSVDESDFQ